MQPAGLQARPRLALPAHLLAALRASRRPQTARRASTALPDVAAAAGSTGGGGGAANAPPSGAELLQQHLSPQQCERVTHEILRSFLEVEVPPPAASASNGNGHHRRSSLNSAGGAAESDQAAAAAGSEQDAADDVAKRPRGVQGRVAEHLLGGGFDEALLEPVPTHTLNWVIKVLGERRAPLLAEQLFHWMRVKGRANQFSFVKLCEACGACRQPWRALQAWRVVRRMPQAGAIVGSHAGAALVLCYRSTADHRGALAALEDLLARGVALDRYAWNAAIRVCADAGAATAALQLLGRMRALAREQQQQQRQQRQQQQGDGGGGSSGRRRGAAPLRTDARTYSAALAALAAAGACSRVQQLQLWMQEDGIVPDAPLITQLLSCYAALGRPAAAQRLFDSLAAADGPPPNRSHWNALLLCYAAAGDVEGAAAAYRRMAGAARLRPDCATLVALLRAAFHAGLGRQAVQAVRAEMARHNVQPNRQLCTAMLCCLRHVAPPGPAAPRLLLAPERAQQAQQQQQQAPQQAEQPEQQPEQAAAYEAAACLAEAAAVWAQLQRQWGQRRTPPDLRAYNALLLARLAAGDHAGVLSAYKRLERQEGVLPDRTTLEAVIAACRAAGWEQREAQYRALLASSRLLGSLGHGELGGGGGGSGSGAATPDGGKKPRRRRASHSGRGGRMPAGDTPAHPA